MTPSRTKARRAAWPGINMYCSPTCTKPVSPTACQRSRSDSRSGAGGVSASTRTPSATRVFVAIGVTAHGTDAITNSGPVASTSSTALRNVGTAQRASTSAPRSALRVTTPTTSKRRFGAWRANRRKNSDRQPLPTTPNRIGGSAEPPWLMTPAPSGEIDDDGRVV